MIGLALVTLVACSRSGITSPRSRGAVEQDLDERRLRDHGAEQLRPDPDRRGRTRRRRRPASKRSATSAPATRARSARTSSPRRVNPAGGTMFNLDWKEGSQADIATLGDDGAFVDDGYAKTHKLSLGSPIVMTFSSGAKKTFVDQGHLQPADGRLAVRDASRSRRRPGTSSTRIRRTSTRSCACAAATTAREPGGARARRSRTSRTRRSQTRQEFIDNQTRPQLASSTCSTCCSRCR